MYVDNISYPFVVSMIRETLNWYHVREFRPIDLNYLHNSLSLWLSLLSSPIVFLT